MASESTPLTPWMRGDGPIPQLEEGDQLNRREFERRYDAMPWIKKAELIEGAVHMPSPVRFRHHGEPHAHAIGWLATYTAETPGVLVAGNASVRLDLDNEPQPDALLLIDPARGGQARISDDDYVEGAPELIVEVSASSVSIDLNVKRTVYRRNGVLEYLVWSVEDRQIQWFSLCEGEFVPIDPDESGVLRSRVFPGLWLDPAAMVRSDLARVLEVVHMGLAGVEHREFVRRLESRVNC